MSHQPPSPSPADRSIPVGILVSVSGKKPIASVHASSANAAPRRPESPPRHESAPSDPEAASNSATIPIDPRPVPTTSGVKTKLVWFALTMQFVALAATWLAPFRSSVKPSVETIVVSEKPKAGVEPSSQPTDSPRPLPAAAKIPPMIDAVAALPVPKPRIAVAPESIALPPRSVPAAPEPIVVEAPAVVPPVSTLVRKPEPKTEVAADEEPVAAVKKPAGALGLKALGQNLIENKPTCRQYGTKIDFFPSPNQAFDKVATDPNKLVMILHIAGNFEEKGLT